MKHWKLAITTSLVCSMILGLGACGSRPGGTGENSGDSASIWGLSDKNFGPTKEAIERWN